ncbi:MAG: hypothetical protein ACAI35_08200 [Candidatus Methylacidiphilales bacterium]|nr:hypothetical protein [Candidatus Methylacidiphilales bacterium]
MRYWTYKAFQGILLYRAIERGCVGNGGYRHFASQGNQLRIAELHFQIVKPLHHMKIQARELHDIADHDVAIKTASHQIAAALEDIAPHISRIEIYLRSRKAGRFECSAKLCMLEARMKCGLPIAVVTEASTVDDAIHGAAGKLKKTIVELIPRVKNYPRFLLQESPLFPTRK